MAPPKSAPIKKQSRRNRKARTEVSSSSSEASSDSEGSLSDSEPKKSVKSTPNTVSKPRESASPSPAEETPAPAQAPKPDTEQAFESFYLRQAAQEFSDDLDKLRSANDFKGQSSVELLVGALKQGGACFSADERRRVGGGGAGVANVK